MNFPQTLRSFKDRSINDNYRFRNLMCETFILQRTLEKLIYIVTKFMNADVIEF